MAGGYKEDNLPQGSDDSSIYSIQYWSHIDTFIYFSHHRITIPPVVWTNAAHRNGVKCLGTIITEWLPGILETDEMVTGPGQCLVNEEDPECDPVDRRWFSKTYADKLVDMAVYYRFDGWFINIESILRGGGIQANQLIAFLAYLRAQIHARIPGGELIWYDSVISTTGEVAWQDKLSVNNYRFFEQTDGIFTNYTWKEHAVGESVALAGARVRDVYTGIDIWGRNTFGGGGYTTYRALEVIQREGTSCAIFAPAWTYESLKKDDFMTNDRLFWTGFSGAGIHAESLGVKGSDDHETVLRQSLRTHLQKTEEDKGYYWGGDGGGEDEQKFLPVSAYIPSRPSGCSTWFYTDFDRGFGKGLWIEGKKVSDKSWSKLSQQSLSPNMNKEIFMLNQGFDSGIIPAKGIRWVVTPEEAYTGGSSVVIQEFSLDEGTPFPPTLPMPIPPPKKEPEDDPEKKPSGPGALAPPALPSPVPSTVPPKDLRRMSLSTARSNSILIPLFDTQISLWSAQNSTVELIFKVHDNDVQVGVHLGILATKRGSNDKPMEVRKVTESEAWSLLHPEIKTPHQRQRPTLGESDNKKEDDGVVGGEYEDLAETPLNLSQFTQKSLSMVDTSKSRGVLAVMTLDDPTEGSEFSSTYMAWVPSLGDEGSVYTVEALADGWSRLTLHLSSLLALHGEQEGDDCCTELDLSTIILSQLGVTLTFESQRQCHGGSGGVPDEPKSTRPLVALGSLAVVPTWSAHYRGSCVQGLNGDDNHVIIVKKPSPALDLSSSDAGEASSLSDAVLPLPVKTCLRISTSLSWDVGFPIVPPGEEELLTIGSRAGSTPSLPLSDDSILPTTDYGHFCIYISTETGAVPAPLPPSGPVAPPPPHPSLSTFSSPGLQEKEKGASVSISDTKNNSGQTRGDQTRGDQVQFVGTAFTNKFRISNLEIEIEGLNPDALREASAQLRMKAGMVAVAASTATSSSSSSSPPNSSGNGVWLWVQGVRRDGRADARADWAKWQLI
ncbi:hypothetical protein BGZ83_000117 [Gryganskiella cystojenkinii]|nr:hypothetical protein BGZ83_000117 [Gryganskiella cystojenkinii]